jgi:L,D-transpeptidase ErfK/SrfK
MVVLLFFNPVHATVGAQSASGVAGGHFVYTVRKGDSLTSIGSRFGVSERVLARDNRLGPSHRLKPGDRLEVYNGHLIPETLQNGIVINIPQRMLFLFRDAKLAASYPAALGRRDWPTPTGNFRVVQIEKDKTWCVPKSIQEEMRLAGKPVLERVPPGPDNPLGGYWMGLSEPGYGIHGTTAPASIYRMQTHGCIRLHRDDAAALYEQAFRDMPVKIIYAPVLLLQLADGQVLVEANPDVYNRGGNALTALREIARTQGLDGKIDWNAAGRVVRAKEGLAREAGQVRSGKEQVNDSRVPVRPVSNQTAVDQAWRIPRPGSAPAWGGAG